MPSKPQGLAQRRARDLGLATQSQHGPNYLSSEGQDGSLGMPTAIPPSQRESLHEKGADTRDSRAERGNTEERERERHCQSPWIEPYLSQYSSCLPVLP